MIVWIRTMAIILCLMSSLAVRTYGQQNFSLDSLTSPTYLDSMLIDHNKKNYSLRIFTNHKHQSFHIQTPEETLDFIPNNRSGLGIGLATSKLLIDVAYNIKSKDKAPTKRFDIRTSFKEKRHFVDFFFQHYKGFNMEQIEQGPNHFRKDIRSISTGINYLYLMNAKDYPVGTMRNVITEQGKTAFTYGLGAFMVLFDQDGEAPLIPASDNNSSGIDNTFGVGGGPLIGLSGFFALSNRLYASATASAGMGAMHKDVTTATYQKLTSDPLLYQLNSTAVIGYVTDKYYLNLSLELSAYDTDLSQQAQETIVVSQAKLALGFKLFK